MGIATVFVLIAVAAIWIAWFIISNNQPANGSQATGGERRIQIDVPEDYDYRMYNIAGANFRKGMSKYVGEFDGRLVAEPNNLHDPNAVMVVHEDGHHLGYIPQDDTFDVRGFIGVPCDCHGIIVRDHDDNGRQFYWGRVVVVKKRQ